MLLQKQWTKPLLQQQPQQNEHSATAIAGNMPCQQWQHNNKNSATTTPTSKQQQQPKMKSQCQTKAMATARNKKMAMGQQHPWHNGGASIKKQRHQKWWHQKAMAPKSNSTKKQWHQKVTAPKAMAPKSDSTKKWWHQKAMAPTAVQQWWYQHLKAMAPAPKKGTSANNKNNSITK